MTPAMPATAPAPPRLRGLGRRSLPGRAMGAGRHRGAGPDGRGSRKGLARSESAVADVVGSILLVGITVVMAAALAVLLFSYRGPSRNAESHVAVSLDPGLGGWNARDENITIRHTGGDSLDAGGTSITYVKNGVSTVLTGATQLGGAFADGTFGIGETWRYPLTLSASDTVAVSVVTNSIGGPNSRQLLAYVDLAPANLGSGPSCVLDASAPTVTSWVQSPSDVRTTSVGAVTVTALAADDCLGVDQTSIVTLSWRLNDGSNPTYNPAGAMTRTTTSTWQGTIPAQTWALQGTKTLQYQLTGLRDLGLNSATIQGPDDVVDVITSFTYVGCPVTVFTGSVSYTGGAATCANLQDNTAASTGVFTEAGTAATVATGGACSGTGANPYCGTTATAIGTVTTVANARASDNARATFGLAAGVDVSNFPTPTGATGIRSVAIGFEGLRTGTVSAATLTYKVGAVQGATSTVVSTLTTGDATYPSAAGLDITNDRAWTVADLANLHVILTNTAGGGTIGLDQAFVIVTFANGGATNRALALEGDFTGVPSGAAGVRTLTIKYVTAGDTYNVQVCQDALATCGSWTTRGLALSGTSTYTYVLTASEYNSGSPRVRILDVTPTSATQGTLTLDYLRVDSV